MSKPARYYNHRRSDERVNLLSPDDGMIDPDQGSFLPTTRLERQVTVSAWWLASLLLILLILASFATLLLTSRQSD